jgi:hypothetical protein
MIRDKRRYTITRAVLARANVYVSLDEKDGRSATAHPTQRNPSRRPRNLPVPTVMGKREKRPKPTSDESAEAEAWLAECSAAKLEPVKQQPPPPAWPDPVQHYGALAAAALASPPTDHLARAFDAAQAVRFALGIGVGGAGGAWLAFAESRLEVACQALREDEELAQDARAFAASEIAVSKHSRSPPSLRKLERLAALDTLRFALWGYARQRGQRFEHPTRLLEVVQR